MNKKMEIIVILSFNWINYKIVSKRSEQITTLHYDK